MAFRMAASKRTEGDGMENSCDNSVEPQAVFEHLKLPEALVSLTDSKAIHGKTVKSFDSKSISTADLVSLKPAVVVLRKLSNPLASEKVKEPKFVPYEPYKAAVHPIVPNKKYAPIKSKIFNGPRERIESNSSSDVYGEPVASVTKFSESDENLKLIEEVQKLRFDNEELEKQLKLQVQINGELKNLLVAAVGEDIETRVNCLAVDKQHLAQKLINSAKNLSTHQEQVEWLASQCEVWRSKFLASSVMVEELARWKASLSHKITEGETVIRKVLDERMIVRRNLLSLHSCLSLIRDKFDLHSKRVFPKTSNVVDLSIDSTNIAKGLIVQLLGGVKQLPLDSKLEELSHFTEAEKAADYMLKHPCEMSLICEPDEACNAVVGAAVALHGQLYHQSNPPRITCCPQCTGQIKLV